MTVQEMEKGWGQARPLVGYALLGVCALTLSLAGVMGGHHLVARIFGVSEEEQAFALDRASEAECPVHLRAADACDSNRDVPALKDTDGRCGAQKEDGAASPPPVRQATIHGVAPETLDTLTLGR